jgi:hypothetical protein
VDVVDGDAAISLLLHHVRREVVVLHEWVFRHLHFWGHQPSEMDVQVNAPN